MKVKTKSPERFSKGYSIICDSAGKKGTINLYGEVVESRPYNYWTGKPVEGQFIVLSDFLADLDKLAEYDELTVHLNSVGGDAYSGLAIYNRLKELPAKVITINDALAASAGSIILQAGDLRRVRKASSTMVHTATKFMCGYYNAAALSEDGKMLKSVDKTIAEAFAENGMDKETALNYMRKTTWLTGEEAVEAGFADEVIDINSELNVSVANNKSYMVSNGIRICAQWLPEELPEGIEIIEPEPDPEEDDAPEVSITENSEETKGEETMAIENLEALVKEYPDLCKELTEQARNEERERIKSINEIAVNVSDRELVENALYGDERISAKDFAYNAMMAGKVAAAPAVNRSVLDALDKQAEESGANAVGQASITQQSDAVREDDAENMDVAKAGAYMKNLVGKGGVE